MQTAGIKHKAGGSPCIPQLVTALVQQAGHSKPGARWQCARGRPWGFRLAFAARLERAGIAAREAYLPAAAESAVDLDQAQRDIATGLRQRVFLLHLVL